LNNVKWDERPSQNREVSCLPEGLDVGVMKPFVEALPERQTATIKNGV
jgi:hypothetical protein